MLSIRRSHPEEDLDEDLSFLEEDDITAKHARAKVDATEEGELSQKYEIQGFSTVLFFVDGVYKPYLGQCNKEAFFPLRSGKGMWH
ncbi:Protein disulfide isomerase-like 1-4 [Acorus gramineus]|uniref:Protein disulfide isomerase-like 1-4 n=1 Tax=Acorus gramineus TaxID=55184 RepID=A0AAV9B6U5_ACOGR|nr:Protein disulfide isomerase-like 1-4 [Acorus gramineus]